MANRKSNLIKREKAKNGPTVYVYDTATAEEIAEVNRLVKLGWISKPIKKKKEEEKKEHKITEEFKISYDEVRKDDMIEYIEKYVKDDENALEKFAVAAYKNKDGEDSLTKSGKDKYNHISAKNYFYSTYFKKEWEEIKKKLEERKFVKGKKKENNDKLLNLLNKNREENKK